MTHRTPPRRLHLAGRTLVELLIALVIGIVIMGAVLMTFINSNRTGNVNQQMATLQQDATFATQLLTTQLKLAGYSDVLELPTVTAPIPGIVTTNRNHGGPPVVGCENGFLNNAALDYTSLTCNVGAPNTQPDSIAIIYEGDTSNTVPTAAGLPTDCLGASVAPSVGSSSPLGAANGVTYARIENRYYVANNSLFCMGIGNLGQGQPVIDNVVDMQITYGLANTPAPGARVGANDPLYEPVMFMRADQVNALPAFPNTAVGPDARWNRVVSATICLLMRSDLGALDQVTPYTDCQGTVVTPAAGDTRAYRLVRIHVGFKNRTPPCPDSNPAAATRIDHCDITL